MTSELRETLLRLLQEDVDFRRRLVDILLPEIASRLSIPLNVATKQDIEQLREEIRRVEEKLRGEIQQVRAEMYKMKDDLKSEIEKVRKELKSEIEQLRAEMYKIRDELQGQINEVRREVDELRREVARTRMDVGALTEATISFQILMLHFILAGRKVLRYERNVRIDNVDVDMLVETEDTVYVIEVKVRPDQSDVDNLLSKLEQVRKEFTKDVKPVLAGIWISSDVISYAKSKGVEVWKF